MKDSGAADTVTIRDVPHPIFLFLVQQFYQHCAGDLHLELSIHLDLLVLTINFEAETLQRRLEDAIVLTHSNVLTIYAHIAALRTFNLRER